MLDDPRIHTYTIRIYRPAHFLIAKKATHRLEFDTPRFDIAWTIESDLVHPDRAESARQRTIGHATINICNAMKQRKILIVFTYISTSDKSSTLNNGRFFRSRPLGRRS